MNPLPRVGLLFVALSSIGRPLRAQDFVPGSREIFSVNFAAEPQDEFPRQLRTVRGNMTMVMKDGVAALRASDPAAFVVMLPERLPNDFTLEFDLIPKTSGNPTDLNFEGTVSQDRGPASAMIEWSPYKVNSVGGGEMAQIPMPDDLQPLLHAQPSEVRVSVKGSTITLFTNGQQIFSLDRKFPRGRVLRVELGGYDDDKYAVYLTKFRVATDSPKAP